MKRMAGVLMMIAAVGAASRLASYASGTSGPAMSGSNGQVTRQELSLYEQGIAAGKREDYKYAIVLFEQASKNDPDNPDILNMLAHAQRKTGLLNEAIDNYWKALKLRPHFPEAREYMGEAYIQAALAEMETLKSYGDDGKEQLEDLTKDFEEAADKLKEPKKQ